ncbi:MAG TPA: 3-phosphoshikimate 1-carboxyvinyltransferase [Casimicrobiaceae bacterium]|nr:3-phosphoshikimate 1-carboxyvinyltransferase [Casimicrobiaceae bacterium]
MRSGTTASLVVPAAKQACGTIVLPGSKSISNRTLLLAALAEGTTTLHGLLDADDVERMREALTALGVTLRRERGTTWKVTGVAGEVPVKRAELFLGNAGTGFRPLTAVLAMSGGDYELRGVPRMHERPIGDLVDALRHLGANVRYVGTDGFPPLAIAPAIQQYPQRVPIRGNVSSQFLSALLMALPLVTSRAGHDIAIEVVGELISRPYVAITTRLMRRFGVEVRATRTGFVVPAHARYRSPGELHVEGDASGASYFLAAGVIGGGPVRVEGVDRESIQGDVAFADVLQAMGGDMRSGSGFLEARAGQGLHGRTIDCIAIPDAAMTLAMVALFAHGDTTLRNIGSWRVKETDRIAAMATELAKLGASVQAGADFLRIEPPVALRPATIDTYDDHRMAMCFALACLGGVEVRINDPQCVAKTYPTFFDEFRKILA